MPLLDLMTTNKRALRTAADVMKSDIAVFLMKNFTTKKLGHKKTE